MKQRKVSRRTVLKGAASVAAASVIPGFLGTAEGQTTQPQPPTGQTINRLQASLSHVGTGWVGTNFIGVSYSKDWLTNVGYVVGGTNTRLFDPSNTALMNFFVTANIQSLRFADPSDKVWDATGSGFVGTQISEADITPLGGFLSASAMNISSPAYRCECLYSVNLEGVLTDPNDGNVNPTGTKVTSPTLAYDEVTFAAGSSGLSSWFGGVEIGNEINSYQSTDGTLSLQYKSGGTEYNWNIGDTTPPAFLSTLELAWEAFRTAIKGSPNGSVLITGPAFDCANLTQAYAAEGFYTADGLTGGKYNKWDPTQFASDEFGKSNLDILTQHYYTGDSHSGSTTGFTPASWYGATNTGKTPAAQPGLLLPSCNADNWTNPSSGTTQYLYLAHYLLPALQGAITGKTGKTYRISECNSYWNGGVSGISNAYGSALWAIDFMFTCAQFGAAGVNFHGGGYAGSIPAGYTGSTSWYTPISNRYVNSSGNLELVANPLYYGMLLFSLAMPRNGSYGQMYPLTLTTTDGNGAYLNGYVVQTGANAYSIVINNKCASAYKLTLSDLTLPGTLAVVTSPQPQVYQITNGTVTANETVTEAEATLSDVTFGDTQINGQSIGTNGTFSPALTAYSTNFAPVYVWPLSTVLIQVTTTGTI